ncbi:DnaB-like helicase N-terminal domain-containing protein [Micromonospora carbonacea]|uniref:DnaB-like helicase N terminal domain-containing protein n=1 Tax=Micromonospora carbonacea TaxID=47853 RepID=A0A1C4V5H2_9ACTN|nr:DnaB-like helicase N-terminal domain-containing protein [Micromonospora carbonacea]SCE79260.1 DnaB-like helicase N terminal domain-containing protein [Micromonospora carbonacea]
MSEPIPSGVPDEERTLIAQLMLGTEHARRIVEFLSYSDMQDPRHQLIYDTISAMCRHQEPMDVGSVEKALTYGGEIAAAGGRDYLRSIVSGAQPCPPGRLLALAGLIAGRAVDPSIPPLGSGPVDHPESPLPAVYLAVDDNGIGWAGLDRQRADERASNAGGVLVALPVIADYRTPQASR